VAAGGRDFVVDLVHRLGVPGDAACGAGHVHAQRVLDGLAHVQRFQQRQFVARGQDLVGKAHQQPLAHGGRLAGPAAVFEGGTGAGHRGVHIGLRATRHLAQHTAVDGAGAGEGLAAGAVAALAVDDHAAVDAQLGGAGGPVGGGCVHGFVS